MGDESAMSPSFTDDPMIGSLLCGRYRVRQVLGEGGAGRVYLATQEAIGRDVAVKMMRYDLHGETQREFAARFQREAEVLGRLSHPNVVTVHDYGATDQGSPFVVMELIRGQSLKDALHGQAFAEGRAAAIAEGIARGLAHAHATGVIHRDIKPSNVHLVDDGDGRERPVILDFGLVKTKEYKDELTHTGTYMGTPAYTAPEQARGEATIDHRADIYALGVLLYRMLAGVVPFQGGSPMSTVVLHITEPYPPIARNAPGVRVDRSLEAIIQKAMQKAPSDRFATAGEMAEALARWQGGERPVSDRVGSGWAAPVLGGVGAAVLTATFGVIGLGALGLGAWWWSSSTPVVEVPTPDESRPVLVVPATPPPLLIDEAPPPSRPTSASSVSQRTPAPTPSRPPAESPKSPSRSGTEAAPPPSSPSPRRRTPGTRRVSPRKRRRPRPTTRCWSTTSRSPTTPTPRAPLPSSIRPPNSSSATRGSTTRA